MSKSLVSCILKLGARIVVNCATRSFVTRTGEMREANGTNAVNETVIEGEVTCAR